jgi:hypothetical protein
MLDGSEAASKFVDTIIDAKLNGTEIEPEVRKTLHRNLIQRLEARISTAIIEQLNTQQQLELEHLVDSDQVDKIESYLAKQGMDLNRTLASVMTEFQASYLGV